MVVLMNTRMDTGEFLARCETLVAVLAAHADEGERIRRLPTEAFEAALQADIFPAIVPTSLGGHGLGLDALAQGTRILAHGCPASAWTISFFMQHAWLLSKFPAEGRQEFFPDGGFPFGAAPLAPGGSVAEVDGGFLVSGTWEWATCVEQSEWVMVHGFEPGPDLATRFFVIPVAETEVEDVWFTSGMRATGSNTVHVKECFVPERRTLPSRTLIDNLDGVEGDGLANIPLVSTLALAAAAPALGAAEAAVELYHERLAKRVLAYSLGDKAAEQPAAQIRLATAMSHVTSARAGWESAIGAIVEGSANGTPSVQLRVEAKLAAAATVRASRQVINVVCEGAGASVYKSDHPLQRLQRDVETLKGHVIFDWDRTAELAGRITLGFGLRPTDMA